MREVRTRRLSLISALVGLVLLGPAGVLAPSPVSHAQTAATPTATYTATPAPTTTPTPAPTTTPTPASTSVPTVAATPTVSPTAGPAPENSCPQITSIALSALSGSSLHAATSVHLHQLLHIAVEWRLGDPLASRLQPSSLVIRRGHHTVWSGWLDVLYPYAVADVVLDRPGDRGQVTVTARLGTPPCASSVSKALRVRSGSPPRRPWVYPDCVSAGGAACWLIAGGFRAHEALSVSYVLRPGGGGHAVKGGLRGQTDGHGIFGSIALDLGADPSWTTAVLRVNVKASRRNLLRAVVHLKR